MPKKNLYVLNREKKQKINNLKWCLHAATKQSESLTKDLREAYTAIWEEAQLRGDGITPELYNKANSWLKENKE